LWSLLVRLGFVARRCSLVFLSANSSTPCGVAFGAVCFIAMQSLDRLGFGLLGVVLSGFSRPDAVLSLGSSVGHMYFDEYLDTALVSALSTIFPVESPDPTRLWSSRCLIYLSVVPQRMDWHFVR
jgi:hypothetical protein